MCLSSSHARARSPEVLRDLAQQLLSHEAGECEEIEQVRVQAQLAVKGIDRVEAQLDDQKEALGRICGDAQHAREKRRRGGAQIGMARG